MFGAYKASTCASECLITGYSLRHNHPYVSGAWIGGRLLSLETKKTPASEFNLGSILPLMQCSCTLKNLCKFGACHMIIKCGYMTGCTGQCRWTSGEGVNSSRVRGMEFLFLIILIGRPLYRISR